MALSPFQTSKYTDYCRYQRLGYGWTSTVLGLLALCIGLPAAVALWSLGEKLRKKSPLAVESQD
jgi:hypothetical protein